MGFWGDIDPPDPNGASADQRAANDRYDAWKDSQPHPGQGLSGAWNELKKVGSRIVNGVKGAAPSLPKEPTPAISKGASAGESGYPSKMAPQQPVSHPGHIPVPLHRTGAANGGHATVHPPIPHTSPLHRHARPPHATAKATGGTQKSTSSGAAAGHPKKKKHKKPVRK